MNGINVVGYITSEFGLGEAVRMNIKAMHKAKIPTSLINIDPGKRHSTNDTTFNDFNENNPYSINFFQIAPNSVLDIAEKLGNDFFKEKYNILFTAWESEVFPKNLRRSLNFFDEIWVPSKFCQDVISRNFNGSVINIPHAIEPKTIDITNSKIIDSIFSKQKFSFLFVFDFNSSIERKNTLSLVAVFIKSFQNNNNVELIIKASGFKKNKKEKAQLDQLVKIHKNIKVVYEIFKKNILNKIIKKSDCYVSLHRSEGFGLTMAEAMYWGKPVIATGYSGNLEFMNSFNSYLINYSLIKNILEDNNYDDEIIWAQPNEEEASSVLKYVYNNYSEASLKGKNGQKTILNSFSVEAIGDKIKNRIDFITNNNSSKEKLLLIELENELNKSSKKLRKLRKKKIIKFLSFLKIIKI